MKPLEVESWYEVDVDYKGLVIKSIYDKAGPYFSEYHYRYYYEENGVKRNLPLGYLHDDGTGHSYGEIVKKDLHCKSPKDFWGKTYSNIKDSNHQDLIEYALVQILSTK